MAITPEKLRAQSLRLHGTSEVLEQEIWRHAEDDSHVERIVEACLARGVTPSVGEIAEIAAVTLGEGIHGPLPDCAYCGGTGWKFIERAGLSGVSPCPCDTRRAAAEAEAKAEAERLQQRESELKVRREKRAAKPSDFDQLDALARAKGMVR